MQGRGRGRGSVDATTLTLTLTLTLKKRHDDTFLSADEETAPRGAFFLSVLTPMS